jgi:hypothetical protein
MIKPTVGRVVWYYRDGKSQVEAGKQPYAAIVAFVWSDTCINIAFFDSNGVADKTTSVQLVQDGDELPEHDFCCWMPYQKGQAAKTEALEKQVASV